MTAVVRGSLFLISVLAGMYSFAAFAAQFETDAYVAALVGILAAGGVVLVDHFEEERRRRLAAYRAQVWDERDGRHLTDSDLEWLHHQAGGA